MKDFFNFKLRNAPTPVKAMALGYVMAISLAYVYAIGNIALVVGLTPKDIAIHYYGSTIKIDMSKNTKDTSSGEESFSFDEVEEDKTHLQINTRPSFKNLVAEGHFHLFGMSSFFFGLTLLGLFTKLSDVKKATLVFIPYVAIVLDNLSFLATRFLGPNFSYLTAASGAVMGICFMILWFYILKEIISTPETT